MTKKIEVPAEYFQEILRYLAGKGEAPAILKSFFKEKEDCPKPCEKED